MRGRPKPSTFRSHLTIPRAEGSRVEIRTKTIGMKDDMQPEVRPNRILVRGTQLPSPKLGSGDQAGWGGGKWGSSHKPQGGGVGVGGTKAIGGEAGTRVCGRGVRRFGMRPDGILGRTPTGWGGNGIKPSTSRFMCITGEQCTRSPARVLSCPHRATSPIDTGTNMALNISPSMPFRQAQHPHP